MFIGSMGRLEYLNLSAAGFSGRIPNSLGNLTNLHFLDLGNEYKYDYDNSLEMNGDTSWIAKLHSLKHLDLSGVFLFDSHNLFKVLNMIPSLLFLDMSQCGHDNSLIPRYAFQNMTSLVYLDLSFNEFHSPIPDSLQNSTSIESLYLSYNNFTSVPSWFSNFEKLIHLDLSFNFLHGPIPNAFRNMLFIESLVLFGNNLTSIPSWLVEFKKLVLLDLSWNQLTRMECSLSSIITNMCHLKALNLYENKLQGELMGHFELPGCAIYDLEVLNLGYNDINDGLPTWLGQLENLEYLDFSSNFLHGPIPLSIGKLSKLQYLDLSKNALEGIIPSNIGQLVNLTRLDISSNKFVGYIPQILGKLENLYVLDLSNNSFNGLIPKSLGQLINLIYLDISSNKLDGITFMEKGWSSIKSYLNLYELNLSHNQISGSFLKNINHIMPSLSNLFLGNNRLNGSIPISLCQIQLSKLDLSKNNFSDEIPNFWKDNQRWSEIKLSSNKLTGTFPSSFENLSSLYWLHLNNNNLQGELPVSLKKLKQLVILDLGENQLFGSIPSSWTSNTFPSLQILRLRQNMLSGRIPSQLCQLKSLKILDIARNKLKGSIPRCIGNLEGMTLEKSIPMQLYNGNVSTEWSSQDAKEVVKGVEIVYTKILKLVVNMDLSENNLVGFIPNEITRLTGLHGLNLSKNQLKGDIPRLIGDMKSLESLDISHNHLSGTIPNSMPALTYLGHLNLSHNNLSGPIPKDNQFLTFNDPSIYAYNSYLCGSPLPNKCPGDNISQGTSESKDDENENGKKGDVEKVWFYFVITLGFATGLWGVIGTLCFKKNWRHAYFRWVEDFADEIYVEIAIKTTKIKKKMMRNHVHG